jgi:mRNA-degrading endonuclease RelE of RelBE toxin-antitoxin system
MSETPRPLDVVLTAHAERELLAIPDEFRRRIKVDILRLAEGRIPPGQFKKLSGFSSPIWQLTSGRFRVFYRRMGEQLLVLRVVAKSQQTRSLRALR